jgi:hypothetical protein
MSLPVLFSFFLVLYSRILIGHFLLSPWHYNICAVPANRSTRRAVNNCRLLATFTYQFVRELYPLTPNIVPSEHNSTSANTKISAQTRIAPELRSSTHPHHHHVKQNTNIFCSSFDKHSLLVDETSNSVGAGTANETNSLKGGDDGAVSMKETAPKSSGGGSMERILLMFGISDIPQLEVFKSGSLEEVLLKPRPAFGTISSLHRLLFSTKQMQFLQPLLSELVLELGADFRKWIDQAVQSCVEKSLAVKSASHEKTTAAFTKLHSSRKG